MQRWPRIIAGTWVSASLVWGGGAVMAATPSSAWTLYHRHQVLVERYEAMHHGKSPLPVDELDHHPDVLRP